MKLPILRIAGWGFLVIGAILNISMFVRQAWPTYLFFLLMGAGIIFIFVSYVFRNLDAVYQIIILVCTILLMYRLGLW